MRAQNPERLRRDSAATAPTCWRRQEQLDIRTRERDEALEQQAATAEVLKVISSSTGKLEPVFQTILENSITICEAKFGMFWLTEGHSFRCVALHGTSPAFTELRRREPIFHPNPTLLSPLGRIARSKQLVHVADCERNRPTSKAIRGLSRLSILLVRALFSLSQFQGQRTSRCPQHFPPGGPSVHRQADRAGQELRRPGRHRHREHAAAQRAAPAHRRPFGIAGAANGDFRCPSCHFQLADECSTSVRCNS